MLLGSSNKADVSLSPPRCALTTPDRAGEGTRGHGSDCHMALEGSKISELRAGLGAFVVTVCKGIPGFIPALPHPQTAHSGLAGLEE